MSEFKEVDTLFALVEPFVKDSRSLIKRPCRDEDVIIEAQILDTLDDGMEIELCLWTDCESHASFWDVSIDKALFQEKTAIDKTLFQEKAATDFLNYLKEKGFHLENVQDRFGGKWHYCGLIDMEKVYRIQYYQDNND